jgi:hypothetical protein
MLGLVCFVGTALQVGNAPLKFTQDTFNDLERKELIKPFLFVAALIVPLGLISVFANWTTRSNDATTMILDSASGRFVNTTSSGYFDDLQLMLAPMTVICVWLFRFRWWTFIPLAAFIALRGGTGGRWPILMTCATVALMFLYQQRKKLPNLKAAGLLVTALWLFQLVGSDRGATIRNLFMEDNSLSALNYNRQELGFLEAITDKSWASSRQWTSRTSSFTNTLYTLSRRKPAPMAIFWIIFRSLPNPCRASFGRTNRLDRQSNCFRCSIMDTRLA